MKGIIRSAATGAAILFLAGCATMAPTYERPAAPVPQTLPEGGAYKKGVKAEQKPLAEVPWRDFFVDPQLEKVIDLALDNNRDLRLAVLNMERYRAQYQIRRADLLPGVDASGGALYQRFPEGGSSLGSGTTVHQYDVGLGVTAYELDLFGRVRSLKNEALDLYLATEQARRSVQITLVSQVSTAYLALASDLERLRLAKDTLANQSEAYRLNKSRFDAGVASALDLQQAQTSVETARFDIARFTTQVAQDVNALNLVVGSPVPDELLPGSLSERLTAITDVPSGLPSEVLLKRPDIMQAEYLLMGANASIGAARAAFFPRITLTGDVGFGSTELAGLFKGSAFTWSFAPRVSLPIFDAGRNKANLKVAEVDRDIAVVQYEKAIQTAFREVADALAQRGTIEEQLAAQKALVDATGETYRLSRARYDYGVDDYLTVLDSQRALYVAQQNLITTRLQRLTNLVALYRVLGGGAK